MTLRERIAAAAEENGRTFTQQAAFERLMSVEAVREQLAAGISSR